MRTRWIFGIPFPGLLALTLLLAACGAQEPGPSGAGRVAIEEFSIWPETLEGPGEVEISWETRDAVSLALSRGGEPVDLGVASIERDSIRVQVAETSTFELVATGSDGATASRSLLVTVEPAPGFPPVIGAFTGPAVMGLDEAGFAVAELGWTGVVGADALWLEAAGRDPIQLSIDDTPDGSAEVELQTTTTFTLVASNDHGEVRADHEVRVVELPRIDLFAADRGWVGLGDPVVVSWETSGAVGVELLVNDQRVATVDLEQIEGSEEVELFLDSTLELRAYNEAGQVVQAELEVRVGAPEVERFVGSAAGLWLGESLEVEWETTGAFSLRVTVEGTGEVLCSTTDIDEVAGSSCRWQPEEEGNHVVTLTVENGSGSVSASWNVEVGSGPRITSFHMSPEDLTVGDWVDVYWSTLPDPLGVEPTLSLVDDRGGTYELLGSSGVQRFIPELAPGTYEFTLTASTDHPKSVEAKATFTLGVYPRPSVTLVATPSFFDEDEAEEVVIEWTSEGASSLILTQLVGATSTVVEVIPEERRAAGSHRLVPEVESTFRIDAANDLGVLAFALAEVRLAPPRVVEFSADVTEFLPGDPIELRWDTRMASEVEISIFSGAYVPGENKEPYIDAARAGGTHLPLTDACDPNVLALGCGRLDFPEGFRFPFSGGSHAAARVFGNGFISFDLVGNQGASNGNTAFPTGSAHRYVHIAPFWDGLYWDEERHPAGNIYYLLQDDPVKGRHLVIQWKDATFSDPTSRSSRLNFEVVLYESGDFDFRYGEMDPGVDPTTLQLDAVEGRGATIGFQLRDGSSAHMRQYLRLVNTWGTLYGRSFSYTPTPEIGKSGSYTWYASPLAETTELVAIARRETLSDEKRVSLTARRWPELWIAQRPKGPLEVEEAFRIGWTSQYATKVTILDQDDGIVCETTELVAEGFCEHTESSEGNYTYRVIATDARGVTTEKEVEAVVYAPFWIESFELDKELVEKGDVVTLSWITHNADRIQLFANGRELVTSSASGAGVHTMEIEEDTTFVLRISNDVGVVREESRSIELWDVRLDVTPSATEARPGETVTIEVKATPLDGGAVPPVYGTFPMEEVLPTPPFQSIASQDGADYLNITNVLGGSTEVVFPEGFSFPFFGKEYSRLRVFVDGYVTFEGGWTDSNNRPLPDPDPGADTTIPFISLAPFWDDLALWGSGSVWTRLNDGNTFVIEWAHASSETGGEATNLYDLNFQIVLQRDGSFEYRYGIMAPPPIGSSACRPSSCENEANGSSATIAYQAPGGTMGYTLHHGGQKSGLGNPTFPGGLANRVFRYEPTLKGTQVVLRPTRTATYDFCVMREGNFLCKSVEIRAEFGIDSFTADSELLTLGGSTTLRWKTHGGTTARILAGDQVIWSNDTLEEADEGSLVVNPTASTAYHLELTSHGNREIVTRYVDVVRLQLDASLTPSAGPGTQVTLSWSLSSDDPNLEPMVIAPMEEVSGRSFAERDISALPDVEVIHAGGVTTAVKAFEFAPDFTFDYLGRPQSQVQIAAAGFLSFDPSVSNASTNNTTLPNAAAQANRVHLAPFWDSLNTRASGRVYAARWDQDTYVIQWSHISVALGSSDTNEYDLNFMVVLHRDGSFEYRYGTMSAPPVGAPACNPNTCQNEANGSGATIGFQDVTNSYGYVLSWSNTPAQQRFVPGGLANRTWRFTPGGRSGSVELRPWETTTYRVCAIDLVTRDLSCAIPVEAQVPWGIASFTADSTRPVAGTQVSLSWDTAGLERLRLSADGVTVFDLPAGSFAAKGSELVVANQTTTYLLEGWSLDRRVSAAQLVEVRTFDLLLTPPPGPILPGDEVEVGWIFTNLSGGSAVFTTPMYEVESPQPLFQDIRGVGTPVPLVGTEQNGYGEILLPFQFNYLGAPVNRAYMYVDGFLSFDSVAGAGNGNNTPLPNPNMPGVQLAPFWDDLIHGPTSSFWVHSPAPDTFIIQWTDMDRFAGITNDFDINFQVVLFSNGAFEYRYGRMAPPPPPFSYSACFPDSCLAELGGSSATIGYQSLGAGVAYVHHFGGNGQANVVPLEGGLENRTLRFEPATIGSTSVRMGANPKDFTVCGTVGSYTACETLRLEPVALPGDLMITELMLDPDGGASGQWFEVRNLRDRPIDLEGFEIQGELGSHRIDTSLVIQPGEFAIFAASDLPDLDVDRIFGTDLSFRTTVDTLRLMAGTSTIASVSWGGEWRIPTGRTLSLDGVFHRAGVASNDDPQSWCDGGAGSPGYLGPGCFHPSYDVDLYADGTFYDISLTGTRIWDMELGAPYKRIRVNGFDWPFFGERYSDLWISHNGWLSFFEEEPGGATDGSPGGFFGGFPRQSFHSPKGPLIGGYWDTLRCMRELNDCFVSYQYGEFGGEVALIVQWTRYLRGTSFGNPTPGELTFQIQLWENGDIAVVFDHVFTPELPGSMGWNYYHGSDAWIGLESADLENFFTAHMRQIANFAHRTIRFTAK